MGKEQSGTPTVAVLGAGTMGSGIAQVAAASGCRVLLFDVEQRFLDRGLASIRSFLQGSVARGRLAEGEALATFERVEPVLEPSKLGAADFAIEAAPEELELKRQVWRQMDAVCPPETIFASNTSSLSVTELASATNRPSAFVGMHFFNPAPLMGLVEVVRGHLTSEEALEAARSLVRRFGKTPVTARDTPGFVVNRIARPFYLEGLRMLGEGLGSVAFIDAAARELGGFKMGPFELMDLIGVEVNLAVTISIYEQLFHNPRLRPHPIQRTLAQSGQFGRKTGVGFYQYADDPPQPAYNRPEVPEEAIRPPHPELWQRWLQAAGRERESAVLRGVVLGRLVSSLANEAAWSLTEAVATREDIDTAMKLGTAYPRGPLEWADQVGLDLVLETLRTLQDWLSSERYQPAPVLQSLVQAGRTGRAAGAGFYTY